MKKTENPAWRFFASVKLALVSLLILATTSIIGTLIPQNNPPEFYIEAFGQRTAQFFQMLDVPDMYNSWWFLSLLFLFSINLIVCTIDRLPNVWQMVVMNNLDIDPERLEKIPHRQVFQASLSAQALTGLAAGFLAKNGWKARQETTSDGALLFAQKKPWSRLGVYAVHLSILVIFAGAIIGSLFGFKANVMIPEGSSTGTAYETGTGKLIDLGFKVQCDDFNVSYYADERTPKEFRSALKIIDPSAKTPPPAKNIVVNDPLHYKGITFYQSSYEPMQGFNISIINKTTGARQNFQIPFGQKTTWPGTDVDFGVINQQVRSRMGDVNKIKIWFFDGQGDPNLFWMENNATQAIVSPTATYELQAGQVYATGLQVAKDPGVWTVYTGCMLMLIGLYVAFFLAHRRVWVCITSKEGEDLSRVIIYGVSNKNKIAFEKEFAALATHFAENPSFTLSTKEQHT